MNKTLYCHRCKKDTPQMVFLTGTVCTECNGTNPCVEGQQVAQCIPAQGGAGSVGTAS